MFGENVSDEISRDLSTTPGASQVLTTISLWMVAINPITKVRLRLALHPCEVMLKPLSSLQTPMDFKLVRPSLSSTQY